MESSINKATFYISNGVKGGLTAVDKKAVKVETELFGCRWMVGEKYGACLSGKSSTSIDDWHTGGGARNYLGEKNWI